MNYKKVFWIAAVLVGLFLFSLASVLEAYYYEEIDVECYDNKNKIIKGLVCEGKEYPFDLTFIYGPSSLLIGLGFVILIRGVLKE